MAAICTKKLTHVYKRHFWSRQFKALSELTLEVEEGEILGYLGANGAGKTTTIKILVGLLRQTGGEASIFNLDSRKVVSRKMIGFQPENPYFYEYLTAAEALRFYGALCQLPRVQRSSRCGELLEFVGLTEAVNVRVGEFSKGMRQRLGIAQALIHKPRLVILDEPMSGLDPVGRMQVREVITSLRDQGLTVFFSSHILSDVELIADRVGLLVAGKLKALGPLQSLLKTRLNAVEVLAHGLSAEEITRIKTFARSYSLKGDDHLFAFVSWDECDRAVEIITTGKGKLRGVKAEKESLEEYFMRENKAVQAEEVNCGEGV